MRRHSRNGQAALEYLITYGWGFLVVLVALGALAYFGFLNPTKYVPERCSFGVQLECVDYRLDSAPNNVCTLGGDKGTVNLQFINDFGDDIEITCLSTTQPQGQTCTGQSIIAYVKKGERSGKLSFAIAASDPAVNCLTKGDRISVPVVITFQRDNSSTSDRQAFGPVPIHTLTGEVFATIQ